MTVPGTTAEIQSRFVPPIRLEINSPRSPGWICRAHHWPDNMRRLPGPNNFLQFLPLKTKPDENAAKNVAPPTRKARRVIPFTTLGDSFHSGIGILKSILGQMAKNKKGDRLVFGIGTEFLLDFRKKGDRFIFWLKTGSLPDQEVFCSNNFNKLSPPPHSTEA